MSNATEICTENLIEKDKSSSHCDQLREFLTEDIDFSQTSENIQPPNAVKIKSKSLPKTAKEVLKKSHGCYWNDEAKAYFCPIGKELSVTTFLDEMEIAYQIEQIFDPYFEMSPNLQKANRLEQARQMKVIGFGNQLSSLKELINDYNKRYKTSIISKDLKPENRDKIKEKIENDTQKRHLDILLKEFERLEKISSEHRDVNLKISDLLIISEEEANNLIRFDFVVEKLQRNERGDAELFLELLKDKYLFDTSEGRNGEFYFWTGTHWLIDRKKKRYLDIETVSDTYEKAANEFEKDEEKKKICSELRKRAYALRSSKRCKSVFEFISSEIPFEKEWDYCPEKLPCANGLLDLKTGQIIQHKPEFYLRATCPTAYNPHAKRPLFDKFLNDITLDDDELKSFLGRVLGAALLGIAKEEKVFIFYGKDGRNGKGTLMQTIEKVLGPIAKTFPSEMILLQRNPPSSSTPRPEKANLQGVRFAIFSEINEGRQIDASEVKNLSGRDTIACRRLFSNVDIQIRPSHTMFIQTNFKPKASAKDGALWKRNILIPFNAEFVDKPDPDKKHQRKKDDEFKDRLLEEREGILAWLVDGCFEYQKKGLAIPRSVLAVTETYRQENDGIGRFLKEMCHEASEFSTQKSKMEKAIKEFCTENKCEMPTRNEISNYLKEKYGEFHTEKGNFWRGVKIVDERDFQQ